MYTGQLNKKLSNSTPAMPRTTAPTTTEIFSILVTPVNKFLLQNRIGPLAI
jgi:hypothetical protein